MTPNELISIAANNLADGGFATLNRDEYLQFVNDVGHDLWSGSKAAHALRTYPLPAGRSYLDLEHDDIIEFASLQIRTADDGGDSEPAIVPASGTAYLVREKPAEQSIRQGQGSWREIGEAQRHLALTPEFRDGRYRIHAAYPFQTGWFLMAHCVIHAPRYVWLDAAVVDPTDEELDLDLTDTERIWEPFRNLFIEGVTWRAARRMTGIAKDARAQIWRDSQQLYYSKYLPDAIHFVHSLKDGTSVLRVEPFNYLPE